MECNFTGSNPVLTTKHLIKPNMANITKTKRKAATTLLNVDLPDRLQLLQIKRKKTEPSTSIADLINEAVNALLRKEGIK